jgi:hypothetical protein
MDSAVIMPPEFQNRYSGRSASAGLAKDAFEPDAAGGLWRGSGRGVSAPAGGAAPVVAAPARSATARARTVSDRALDLDCIGMVLLVETVVVAPPIDITVTTGAAKGFQWPGLCGVVRVGA